MNAATSVVIKGIGFFTIFLVLTLNSNKGVDLLDTLVPYVQAHTAEVLSR